MFVRNTAARLRRLPGAGSSHVEKCLSVLGGGVGLLGVVLISQASLGLEAGAPLIASMGASAVLLFAVPHGPLSQPWPVLGGHLVSALIGVACATALAQTALSIGLAVALAIGAMHYLRCLHPPGGATALTAVIGDQAIHDLGFQFVLTPVLLNAVSILALAFVFNYAFPWRRYPAFLSPSTAPRGTTSTMIPAAASVPGAAPGADNTAAPDAIDALTGADIRVGACYSNGAFSEHWQVRRVQADPAFQPGPASLAFEVVAGQGRRHSGVAGRDQFAAWARYEVYRDETSWRRIEPPARPNRGGPSAGQEAD